MYCIVYSSAESNIQIFDIKEGSCGLVNMIKYVGGNNDDYTNRDLIIICIVII